MRHTSSALRRDLATVADLIQRNLGRGYYRFDHFPRMPAVDTDASKSPRYVGGGYFSRSGHYRYWLYGGSARLQPIDWLEGHTVLVALADLGHIWRGCVVPFNVDTSAVQRSALKSWSRAQRLAEQIRRLCMLQLEFGCVLDKNWISTANNVFADALSLQDGHRRFLDFVSTESPHSEHVEPLPPGTALLRDPGSETIRKFGPCEYPSDVSGDGPSGRGVSFSMLTVPYSRASVYAGLPTEEVAAQIDELLDNCLAPLLQQPIMNALVHWRVVAARHNWNVVIQSDNSSRGGKLATYISFLVNKAPLSSASTPWVLRNYMKYNRQLDPAYGVAELEDLMKSVQVVAWVASELYRAVPVWFNEESLERVDVTQFVEVQAVFLMVISYSPAPVPSCRAAKHTHLLTPRSTLCCLTCLPKPHLSLISKFGLIEQLNRISEWSFRRRLVARTGLLSESSPIAVFRFSCGCDASLASLRVEAREIHFCLFCV
eukprot:5481056-Pleurochrysis_carterae.AAC.1